MPQDKESQLFQWARELISLYESGACNQFILHGNIGDRMILPLGETAEIGNLTDYLLRILMPSFDVILSYDLGNGVRLVKGEKKFAQWVRLQEKAAMPREPNAAVEYLTHYFRYCANMMQLKGEHVSVGCIMRAADLAAPAFPGGLSYDLSALALQIHDWSTDTALTDQPLATFLLAENLNDLHPHLVANNRAAHIQIPLPSSDDLEHAFEVLAPKFPKALADFRSSFKSPAQQLTGATLASIEAMLKTKEHKGEKLTAGDLVKLKKELVEKDCGGLIEFIESKQTLDDLYGQEKIKAWLKQDIALWQANDTEALPMGYLICGPVGTGKTFMVRCLAGQAGVPVVKMKNFRDKWVGSSEGNLEKIFRLLHALGRCFVFVDEADQALGRRDSGGEDSGISGRLYSMMAEEMSNTRNRGKIIWILASSRPDLIEVDLKRPGRVDVKIPIFPTSTAIEGFNLLRALCKRRNLEIAESDFAGLEPVIPTLLTPGGAEALAVKAYRLVRTQSKTALEALRECLHDYQNPIPSDVMQFQIEIAVREASDLDFVPECYRALNR